MALHLKNTPSPPPIDSINEKKNKDYRITYGENSRRFRRTIYKAEDWIFHRDPDRFFSQLASIFRSGVAKQVFNEVALVTFVAIFVCAWNGLFLNGYSDFSGGHHEPLYMLPSYLLLELPIQPFELSSTVLGLLLVFRTNTSYGRWNEARSLWGMIINHSRNIMRMSTSWVLLDTTQIPNDTAPTPTTIDFDTSNTNSNSTEALEYLTNTVWLFSRCLQSHLWPPPEDEPRFRSDVRARLTPSHAEACINAEHRPTRGLVDLGNAVDRLPLPFVKRLEIDKSVRMLGEMGGTCEQIYSSPVPLVYTRFTARVLSLWLLLLPLGLYTLFGDSWNHLVMVPCSAITAFFYFGIEELAVQLEEPFSVLPIDGFSDGIYARAKEYVQYHREGAVVEEERRLGERLLR